MKIVIEGTGKEITELVLVLQARQIRPQEFFVKGTDKVSAEKIREKLALAAKRKKPCFI